MKTFIAPFVIAITFAFSQHAYGQGNSLYGVPNTQRPAVAITVALADAALGDAVVKRIDKTRGAVILQHGALPNGMPPMTMAYRVKDKAWLDQLKPGQKIRFATDPADGGMTVTKIVLVK